MLYAFARWRPSKQLNRGSPTVFYIPCGDEQTGYRLLKQMKRFGAREGEVVDLPGLYSLRNYVAMYYEISDFDLTVFPIPTEKLLQDSSGG